MKVKNLIVSGDFYVVSAVNPRDVISNSNNPIFEKTMILSNRICLLNDDVFVDLEDKQEYKKTMKPGYFRVVPGTTNSLANYYFKNGIAIPTIDFNARTVHSKVRNLLKSDVFEFWDITDKMNNIVVLDALIPSIIIGGAEEADVFKNRICLEESNKYIDIENNTSYFKDVGIGVARPIPDTVKPLSSYFYKHGIAKKENEKTSEVYQKIRNYMTKSK